LTDALLPVLAIAFDPVGYVLQWCRLKPARSPLRLPPLRDQPRVSQHLEVLRDRRQFQLEGLGQLHHGGLALGRPRVVKMGRGKAPLEQGARGKGEETG